jgi:hypothetical protein
MFINRRLYQFQNSSSQPDQGLLILGPHQGRVRKTGRTQQSLVKMDTMTGKKQVIQYYDEFESLDAQYQLEGNSDEPRWVRR